MAQIVRVAHLNPVVHQLLFYLLLYSCLPTDPAALSSGGPRDLWALISLLPEDGAMVEASMLSSATRYFSMASEIRHH